MVVDFKLSTFVALAMLGRFMSTALLVPLQWRQAHALRNNNNNNYDYDHDTRFLSSQGRAALSSSSLSSSSSSQQQPDTTSRDTERNTAFVRGLMENLSKLCDRYICNGSPKIREQIFNVLDQIAAEAVDREQVHQSIRMVTRAGVPMHKSYLEKYQSSETVELAKNDSSVRREEVGNRKDWEREKQESSDTESSSSSSRKGKSALSRRMTGTNGGKPDLFTPSILNPDSIATIANDKNEFQKAINGSGGSGSDSDNEASAASVEAAASRVSELIAKAGSGAAFEGQSLGVGGLDDVLVQIKRRIWTPLAAPPQLLNELGIHPARGLLLYGKPGCGKTLLASTLGSMLSPFRPITVVNGPEILDKFVGSSEKNLRDIFDNPPDIYEKFRQNEEDDGDSIASAALHVVIMDEFDAVARSRGGSDGKGGQGDAGVARDSVVNQLLAKMDGVQPLAVPTLVIGLTNKRSLVEPALLRPGRFEVQIEIPPPRTTEQRVSILKVHTKHMLSTGRLQVNDPPPGTTAEKMLQKDKNSNNILSYEELLTKLAMDCEGFSGAAIASVARAAASRALERAVEQLTDDLEHSSEDNESVTGPNIMNCLVTQEDFDEALDDVRGSMGSYDHTEHDADDLATKDDDTEKDTEEDN